MCVCVCLRGLGLYSGIKLAIFIFVVAQIKGYSFAVRPLSKLNTRAFPAGNCASKMSKMSRFTLIYVRKGEQAAYISISLIVTWKWLMRRKLSMFLQRAQCWHCKRCISYSNSVCLFVTRRYCVKTTARSTVQFALLDSKMCLVL